MRLPRLPIEFKVLSADDKPLLQKVSPDLFDNPVDEYLASQFLLDPHHHMAVALEGGVLVGFVSGVSYLHPDKPLELWINEVAVVSSHRRQGIGTQLIKTILSAARDAGCGEAWVLTERSNPAAMQLYESVGGTQPHPDPVMFSFRLD